MSSATHSPPKSPPQHATVVDQEKLNPNVRPHTPSDDPKQISTEAPIKEANQSQHGSQIQVPTTLPIRDEAESPVDRNAPLVEQIHSDPLDNAPDETENERAESEGTEIDPNADLFGMDWADFQNRYEAAVEKANEEEEKLLQEFEQYFEVFRVWCEVSSAYDNERGFKRLRTRQRYVQLAEGKLEEKKAHYEAVVLAFKKALELLRG